MTIRMPFYPVDEARSIIAQSHVYRLSTGHAAQLVSFDPETGLYVVQSERLELQAQRHLDGTIWTGVKSYHVQEVLKAIRRNAPAIAPTELNDPRREVIVFKNGIFDLTTRQLQQHSPDFLYTIGIPHNYIADATCPQFDKFIDQILPPDTHELIKQMLGYLFIPSTQYRKCFVFIGNGANGKSTLILIIEALLGNHNVSHHSLIALSDRNFALSDLFGKLANTYADLDDEAVKKVGLLKQIVAGDTIFYEEKFKNPFGGPVTARLVFSANKMPRMKEESHALADRLIIIEFPYRFTETQQDRTLINRLTTEVEIEGIIARYVIPGLLSLRQTGRFLLPERSSELLRQYLRDADPVLEFFQDHVVAVRGTWVKKHDLYQAFQVWCSEQGIAPIEKREFNQRVRDRYSLEPQDKRHPKTRERIWPGLQLKRNPDADPAESQGTRLIRLVNPRDPSRSEG